jgi:hypothetical protein
MDKKENYLEKRVRSLAEETGFNPDKILKRAYIIALMSTLSYDTILSNVIVFLKDGKTEADIYKYIDYIVG